MIRFGIIGSNFITERFLLGVARLEDATITAIYSRTQERADEYAKQHNIPNTFTNLEEMAQSDLIDAVYIASPHALHHSQAIIFMNNKKHVLCEKAFAPTVAQVDEMIQCANDNNVILMEAIKNIHVPNFKVLQDNIDKIGKVRKYFAQFCQYSSRYNAYKQGIIENAFKPELANGALVDIGVYCIAPMVRLFGKPKSLQATGYMLETGVDAEGAIIFTYPEMTAVVQYSKISTGVVHSEIQGEDGTIIINKISQIVQVSMLKDGEEITLGEDTNPDDLYDETLNFVRMIQSNNYKLRDELLEQTRIVIGLMQEARRQIGVVYPNID